MYMEWFRFRFPNHPLSKTSGPITMKMVLQTIRGVPGIKDTGAEWYRLLSLILNRELGMVHAKSNKRLFY